MGLIDRFSPKPFAIRGALRSTSDITKRYCPRVASCVTIREIYGTKREFSYAFLSS